MRILGVTASSILKVTSSYESIASATGTGSSATITFSSIPSTYSHLQLRWIARSTFSSSSAITIKATINSDTGSNYAYHQLFGDGVSATAAGTASDVEFFSGLAAGNTMTSGIMGVGILDITDYASTTKTKTFRIFQGIDSNASTGSVRLQSGLWNSTTAMSSISFLVNNGNFGTTTQFALYGIKGA